MICPLIIKYYGGPPQVELHVVGARQRIDDSPDPPEALAIHGTPQGGIEVAVGDALLDRQQWEELKAEVDKWWKRCEEAAANGETWFEVKT